MADQGRVRTDARTRTHVQPPRSLAEKAEQRHHRLYAKNQRAQQLAESQGRRGTPRTNIRADSRTQAPAPDRVKDLGFERPAASGSTPLITVTSDAARKARRAEHVLGET